MSAPRPASSPLAAGAGRLAIGYLRRSSERQPLSLEQQQDVLTRWASDPARATLGDPGGIGPVTIERWVEDDSISGATADERAGFQSMIRLVEERHAAGALNAVVLVLVYDVARFGRTDNDEAGYYRHRLRSAGCEVVYVAETAVNGSETDDLVLPIIQFQKREFLRDVSRSSLRGQLERARRGGWSGGPAPFGYVRELRAPDGRTVLRRVPHGERSPTEDGSLVYLVPSEVAAEVDAVRLAWELYWVRGEGLDAVRDAIAALGTPPRRAGAWRTSVVRAIVTNPVFTGRITYGLRAVGKFYRATADGPEARPRALLGRYVRDASARPVVVEGAHPALVSPEAVEVFRRWETRERERRAAGVQHERKNRHEARSEYLLSGLIRCACCGFRFTGQRRTRRGIEYPDYLCSGFVGSGRGVCQRFPIPGDALDAYVLGEVRSQWRGTVDPERVRAQLVDALGAGAGAAGDASALRRQVEALDRRMVAIATAVDPEHAAVANDAIRRLKADRGGLAARLAEAEARATDRAKLEKLVDRLVALLHDAPALWQAASPRRRRVLVRSFVAGISVDPRAGTIAVDFWRVPKVTTARDTPEGAASRGVVGVAGVDSSYYATGAEAAGPGAPSDRRRVRLIVLPGREIRAA